MEESPSAQVRRLVARTIDSLVSQGVHDEALGVMREPRGFSVFKTAPMITPAGRAWRLGVLLVDRDGGVYETGDVTRAIEPLRAVTNRSAEAEARRDDRRAAARGKFPEGEVVNHRFVPLALDDESLDAGSGPLQVRDGMVVVQWDRSSPGHGVSTLDRYLADRVSVLTLD
ncbi:hypothetical protein ASF06_06350 [Agreia sp. Leaf244]|uniref:hypothetical protein n=1 Tax=Agreia sp. Leaf244 TaxID=1736305 RepID=UPI0006FB73CE|nr:hypothetical protein [Agreia sp. Leaf244]KQO09869.1 hypothetical protein ASF06_06350 [Agreia sp. Leaf244]